MRNSQNCTQSCFLDCCLQCFEPEHGSTIVIAHCKMFKVRHQITARSFSPSCLLFLPAHLSSIVCCQKTARRQGTGAGVITGREGRKEGRRDSETKEEAVCNNCVKVRSRGFHLLCCGHSEGSGVALDAPKIWIMVEKEHHV